jgi:hypothetical protein
VLPVHRVLSDANTEECDDDRIMQITFTRNRCATVRYLGKSRVAGCKEGKGKIQLSPSHGMIAYRGSSRAPGKKICCDQTCKST